MGWGVGVGGVRVGKRSRMWVGGGHMRLSVWEGWLWAWVGGVGWVG